MTTINIKVVGHDGDSVLIKYASNNSLKPIDAYDAVAYQPKSMGYTNVTDFLNGIKESVLSQCILRDKLEKQTTDIDLSSWRGASKTHKQVVVNPSPEQTSNLLNDSNAEVQI